MNIQILFEYWCYKLIYLRRRICTPSYEFILFVLPAMNSYFLYSQIRIRTFKVQICTFRLKNSYFYITNLYSHVQVCTSLPSRPLYCNFALFKYKIQSGTNLCLQGIKAGAKRHKLIKLKLTLWTPDAGIPALRKLPYGAISRYTVGTVYQRHCQKPVYRRHGISTPRARSRYTGFVF